jgi:hypothetical protein
MQRRFGKPTPATSHSAVSQTGKTNVPELPDRIAQLGHPATTYEVLGASSCQMSWDNLSIVVIPVASLAP